MPLSKIPPIIHSEATITAEEDITDSDVVKDRPDIVLDLLSKTCVLDVAVPLDNSVEAAEHANVAKRRRYNPTGQVKTNLLGVAFCARGLVGSRTRRAEM